MAGFLSSQIVMFNVQCSNAESAGRDSRYLGNKTIFDECINFDPSSPFNQLRFFPWYDAILVVVVGGLIWPNPGGLFCGPPFIYSGKKIPYVEYLVIDWRS